MPTSYPTLLQAIVGAYQTIGVSSLNGSITSGSPVATVSSTAGLTIGSIVTSPGAIAPRTLILSIDSGTQITLNQNALQTGSAQLNFSELPPLWLEAIPDDQLYTPSAYLIHENEEPVFSTGNPKPEMLQADFQIWLFESASPVIGVEALASTLKTAFVPTALSMSGSQTAWLFRTGYKVEKAKQKTRDPQVQPVYQAVLSYHVQVSNPAN